MTQIATKFVKWDIPELGQCLRALYFRDETDSDLAVCFSWFILMSTLG